MSGSSGWRAVRPVVGDGRGGDGRVLGLCVFDEEFSAACKAWVLRWVEVVMEMLAGMAWG